MKKEEMVWTKEDLITLGRYHGMVQWYVLACIIANIFLKTSPDTGLMAYAGLAAFVLSIAVGSYILFKYLKALKSSYPIITVVLTWIPLLGMLILLFSVRAGNKVFQKNGVKVGIMGAKISALESGTLS